MSVPDEELCVRPTLRCLEEDLGDEVEPGDLRAALRTFVRDQKDDPNFLLPCPISGTSHAVLDQANMLARDSSAEREPIEVITDRHAITVKTGDLSDALWQDDDGTWWLMATGRRKDDGPGPGTRSWV
jgi:hypothetical protein